MAFINVRRKIADRGSASCRSKIPQSEKLLLIQFIIWPSKSGLRRDRVPLIKAAFVVGLHCVAQKFFFTAQ